MLNTINPARKKIASQLKKNYPRPSGFGKMILEMKVDFVAPVQPDYSPMI